MTFSVRPALQMKSKPKLKLRAADDKMCLDGFYGDPRWPPQYVDYVVTRCHKASLRKEESCDEQCVFVMMQRWSETAFFEKDIQKPSSAIVPPLVLPLRFFYPYHISGLGSTLLLAIDGHLKKAQEPKRA
ncbi:uncharacterized protein LOC144827208 [Lissotriton helveticus]